MTLSALSSSASDATRLIMMTNGEYTASSVFANPGDATVKGLVKQSDGNYGIFKMPALTFGGSAVSRSSSGVQAAVASLQLGG